MSNQVRAGEIYRHHKGKLYMVLAVADYTGERKLHPVDGLASGFPESEKLVVYVGLYDNPCGNRPCTRPLSEWSQEIETQCPFHADKKVRRPRYTKVST